MWSPRITSSLLLPPLTVEEFDEDVLVSGWGEVDDMREDLLKDWGDLLDKWDGKDRSRPSKLIKLCRKVRDIEEDDILHTRAVYLQTSREFGATM